MWQFNNVIKGFFHLMGLILALGAHSAWADAQNKITALTVTETGGGNTVIRIQLAEPLANTPVGFTINLPPRIALDFPNTENAMGKSVQDISQGDLRNANIIQAGTRTRVVVNLNQMLAYDTKMEGSALVMTLHAKAAVPAVENTVSRFAEARQGPQKHTLNDLDFRRGKNGESRIQVDLSDSGGFG